MCNVLPTPQLHPLLITLFCHKIIKISKFPSPSIFLSPTMILRSTFSFPSIIIFLTLISRRFHTFNYRRRSEKEEGMPLIWFSNPHLCNFSNFLWFSLPTQIHFPSSTLISPKAQNDTQFHVYLGTPEKPPPRSVRLSGFRVLPSTSLSITLRLDWIQFSFEGINDLLPYTDFVHEFLSTDLVHVHILRNMSS